MSPATLSEILMKALQLQVSLSFYRKKLRRTRTGMSSVVSNREKSSKKFKMKFGQMKELRLVST